VTLRLTSGQLVLLWGLAWRVQRDKRRASPVPSRS